MRIKFTKLLCLCAGLAVFCLQNIAGQEVKPLLRVGDTAADSIVVYEPSGENA
jgi:hypothetical protein